MGAPDLADLIGNHSQASLRYGVLIIAGLFGRL